MTAYVHIRTYKGDIRIIKNNGAKARTRRALKKADRLLAMKEACCE